MFQHSRSIRRVLGGAMIAVSAITLSTANQAPASATAVAGSGYATTGSVCNPLGLYTYQGHGFDSIRAIRFIWGQGWVVDPWSQFKRTWNEEPINATSPIVPSGKWSALYIQFASYNVIDGSWSYAGEWVKQGAGYWCQA